MKIQTLNDRSVFSGSNIVKINKNQLADLGQDILESAEKAKQRLTSEGKGENFLRIGRKFEPIFNYVPCIDSRCGITAPATVLMPTNDVLVTARKQAKTLGEKIKLFLGLACYSPVVAKSTKEEDIVQAGKEALDKLI